MHLRDTEFVDLLDGALPPPRAAHVSACPECGAQLDVLRATLATIEADGAPEPSPLFWTALPARVNAAIDSEPRTTSWLPRPVFAALGCAAALLIVMTGAALWLSPERGTDLTARPAAPAAGAAADSGVVAEEDVEHDAAWAVVRIAADDLEYDDAVAAGISAGPGAAERAAMELSGTERAELVRLLQREMKRSGA